MCSVSTKQISDLNYPTFYMYSLFVYVCFAMSYVKRGYKPSFNRL